MSKREPFRAWAARQQRPGEEDHYIVDPKTGTLRRETKRQRAARLRREQKPERS